MDLNTLINTKLFSQAWFWLGILCACFILIPVVALTLNGTTSALLAITIIMATVSMIALGLSMKTAGLAESSKNDLAEITLHSISEGVITTNVDEVITHLNPFACRLTGWNHDAAVGQALSKVLLLRDEQTHEPIEATARECMLRHTEVELNDTVILTSQDGRDYSVELSVAPIENDNHELLGCVVVFRDVTRIREMSKKMEFQAKHDSLTNLINRREFEHQLKLAINSACKENLLHTLCYMDLDQFKIVNDTCGHIAGDQLLRELAKLMPFSIRSSDCLARLGGDEFGVIMFDCPMEQAVKIAEDLRSAISDFTFTWDKKIFDIGVSIGLVSIDASCGSLQDVLRRADASCYIAKDLGRNRIHIYSEDDQEHARRRGELQWLTKIHNTLKEDRFRLALQPVKPIDNSIDAVHYEVLLRMEDEQGDTVPPTSFLPAAERYDMMPVIDRWVITTAFQLINTNAAMPNAVYNINLSGQSLRDESILDYISSEIDNYHVPADTICFEITETAAIANLGFAIELIDALKKLGCQFALDDFGSGLSSFTYLKRLPVDYLKIDGAFVSDAINSPKDRAIVSAINTIGHEMGLKTVAEYVDNEETLTLIQQMGVNYAQGYAIGKPAEWTN